MKKYSLKNRILYGVLAVVIIPFLIAGTIVYNRIASDYENLAKTKTQQIAADMANLLDMAVLNEVRFIGSIAADPRIFRAAKTGNYLSSDIALKWYYENLGTGYEGIFLTDSRGLIRSDGITGRIQKLAQENKHDISQREYFTKGREGNPGISIPVVSRASGDFILVVYYPVISERGDFLGIVAGALNLNYIIKYIGSIRVGNTGYAFLTDENGLVLVHPDRRHILNSTFSDYPSMSYFTHKLMNNESGAGEYLFEGVEKIGGFATSKRMGWKVVVTQNLDEIMEPASSVFIFLLFSAFLFFAGTSAGIVYLSGRISAPVEETIKILTEISTHSAELVITLGLNREIKWANYTAQKLTGKSLSDMIGARPVLNNLNQISEEDIWERLENGNTWYGRIVMKGADNKDITLETIIFPVKDESGKIYSFIEIGRDITLELAIENRIKQSQKIEAIGTLAGGIAHDFNNILAGIFGYVQISLVNPDDRDRVKYNLEQILKAAERARDLVQQILTFSRDSDVEMRPVNVASVINETMVLLRASIPANIEINEHINSNASILGDRTQLHRVLVNIVTNAYQAIGSSRGVIEISLIDLIVDKDFSRLHPGLSEGRHIQITVTDSGGGMKPEIIEKIFDPFFTTKAHGEGTGLGLSVVHGIIKKLNGIILVYSEPGIGTSFNIIVPIIMIDENNDPEPIPDYELSDNNERIMLIDDESAILDSLKPGLEMLGFNVITFTEPYDALQELSTNRVNYDVVITDNIMPLITGIEIAEEISRMGYNIPVILSSGFIDSITEKRARESGVSGIIRKPATLRDISSAVKKVIM